MENYRASTYGEGIADIYDDWYDSSRLDPVPAVRFLAGLVTDGKALEFGVGTGRVAIPLAARGVTVTGVDASRSMIDALREKPGSSEIRTILDDFLTVRVDDTFSTVYCVFSTFYSMLTQRDQIHCLRNAARHLISGGHLVLELFVHDAAWWNHGQELSVQRVRSDVVFLVAAKHDPVAQKIDQCYIRVTEQGVRLIPVPMRYVYPAELDAMALLAGLELVERLDDFDGRAFDERSTHHVSVYRKHHEGSRLGD